MVDDEPPVDDDIAPQQRWGCVERKNYNEVWSATSPVLTGDIDYMGSNQFCIFDDPVGPTTGDIYILEIIPKQVLIVKTVKSYLTNIDPRGICYDGCFFHVIYKDNQIDPPDYSYEQIDISGNTVRDIKSIKFPGEVEGMCCFIEDGSEYFAIVERGTPEDHGDSLHILDRNFSLVKSFVMGDIPLGTAFGIIHDGMNFVVANKGDAVARPGFKIIDPVSTQTVSSIKASFNYNGIAFDGLQIYYNMDPVQLTLGEETDPPIGEA